MTLLPRRHPLAKWPAVVLLALALAASSGCGSRAPVTGRVTDGGNPVAKVELSWISEADPSLFGSAVTDAAGTYIVESGGKRGLPPGRYQVRLTWWRTRDGKPLPAGEAGEAMKGTPRARQFTATLSQEVTATTTTLDLDVTGKATPVEDH